MKIGFFRRKKFPPILFLIKLLLFLYFKKSVLAQISIVSSSGMLVKRQPTSRKFIKNSNSFSKMSSKKVNESFTHYYFNMFK